VYNERQFVEIFHLLFLDQMGRKLDKKFYALKGGCNLRFYHNSIRYSEDMDFDVQIIAKETLKKKIELIIDSQPFKQILRSHQIEIAHCSAPKQTETTQRWKIILKTPLSLPINTKIEFSRREFDGETCFDMINSPVLQFYKLMPILTNHYSSSKAIEQKINALIFRTQTQARDVFDLCHLIITTTQEKKINTLSLENIERAELNAIGISFAEFKSQVVAFLPNDYHAQYNSPSIWNHMVETTIKFIETLKP